LSPALPDQSINAVAVHDASPLCIRAAGTPLEAAVVKSKAMDGRGRVDDLPSHILAESPQRNSEQECVQKQWSRPVSRVLCALRRDSHSSRPGVAAWLKQPTRERRGPRHRSPIWSCSGWGLPCRSVARLAVGSYPTVSPLPAFRLRRSALCCTFRRLAPPRRYLAPCPAEPGLSSAFRRMTRLSGRLHG